MMTVAMTTTTSMIMTLTMTRTTIHETSEVADYSTIVSHAFSGAAMRTQQRSILIPVRQQQGSTRIRVRAPQRSTLIRGLYAIAYPSRRPMRPVPGQRPCAQYLARGRAPNAWPEAVRPTSTNQPPVTVGSDGASGRPARL